MTCRNEILIFPSDVSSQLEDYYNLTYTVVSLIFLSPLIGYTASALLNNSIHLKFGQRGVAFLSPGCHLLAYIVIAVHPPYPVLVVIFAIAGFGSGLEDAAWNAWVGNMANPNEVLGFLHAFYGLGATLSPLIATSMITKGGLPWYVFYYLMVSSGFSQVSVTWMGCIDAELSDRRRYPRTRLVGMGFLGRNRCRIPCCESSHYRFQG